MVQNWGYNSALLSPWLSLSWQQQKEPSDHFSMHQAVTTDPDAGS